MCIVGGCDVSALVERVFFKMVKMSVGRGSSRSVLCVLQRPWKMRNAKRLR